MQPSIKLQLKPRQQIFLSPAFKQGIKIFSLPILELKELIEEEILKNPLLEADIKPSTSLPDISNININAKSASENLNPLDKAGFSFHQTLNSYLLEQARIHFSEQDYLIAEYIIGSLNEKGFLTEKIKNIAMQLKEREKKVRQILKEVQLIAPIGIGSQSLKDFFLLQLKEQKKEHSIAYKIIKKHFALFLKQRKKQLLQNLNISESTLEQALQDIKKLSLNPAAEFILEKPQFIVPDLRIEYKNGHFLIFLNKDFLPSLKINHQYLNLIANQNLREISKKKQKTNTGLSLNEHKFLKNCFFSARNFLKNLQRRNRILKQLAVIIVKKQKDYLLGNLLSVLSLTETAKALNISESSLYRIVKYKYVLSPRGLEPLKNFFSLPVTKSSQTSKNSAAKILQKLIQEENKKQPLSDRELTQKLSLLGIFLKRRTVSKYRKKLNIVSACLRKIS